MALPIKFPEANVTYAENQKEYLPLPALKSIDGIVISCWKLSDEELKEIQRTGLIYLSVHTFNNPLQPLMFASKLSHLIPPQTRDNDNFPTISDELKFGKTT